MHSLTLLCAVLIVCPLPGAAQIGRFPFEEAFDSSTLPDLPPGWTSSSNRTAGVNDFTTVSSSPHSPPNALLSTNATISQWVASPQLDFTGLQPDSVSFSVRRSASHGAPIVVECSIDGGTTFTLILPDSVLPDGSTDYRDAGYPLPAELSEVPHSVIRWRIVPAATGTAGTVRLDNIRVTALHQVDLGIEALSYEQGPLIRAVVQNNGTEQIHGFSLTFFLDENRDSIAEPTELLGSSTHTETLGRADSAESVLPVPPLHAGAHQVIGILFALNDTNPFNDTLIATLTAAYPPSSLLINEVMYQPLSGGSEYVELHNPGTAAIDLAGWIISDRPGADGSANELVIPDGTGLLQPGGYLLAGTDTLLIRDFPSIPPPVTIIPAGPLTLNNDGDCLILLDPVRTVVDSVPYEPGWHHDATLDETGRSLERISSMVSGADRRNWSTCTYAEGGSPGAVNSIALTQIRDALSLTFTPNPFSPDGDGHDDFVLIQFDLPTGSYSFSIRLFDTDGRLIRRLATNEPAGREGSVLWDGLDDFGHKARIGIYVVLLEIHGDKGEVQEARKNVIVLAGRL